MPVVGNHRGASSDADAEMLGFLLGISLSKDRSETAKSLPVCKVVLEQSFVPLEVISNYHPR